MRDRLHATVDAGATRRPAEAGQTLVEFAMVMPMLLLLFMGVLEFSLALNASLAVNRASQQGAHVAASAGNLAGADCLILDAVESALGTPNSADRISEVLIERTALTGDQAYATQRWVRGGSTTCTYPDGSDVAVPYTRVLSTYPEDQRCTVLAGCPLLVPPRSTVDDIGVTVRYTHAWITPLNGALDMIVPGGGGGSGSSGWSFERRNIFRLEPTL
jgi:Flp pilus assembly protein TadG